MASAARGYGAKKQGFTMSRSSAGAPRTTAMGMWCERGRRGRNVDEALEFFNDNSAAPLTRGVDAAPT